MELLANGMGWITLVGFGVGLAIGMVAGSWVRGQSSDRHRPGDSPERLRLIDLPDRKPLEAIAPASEVQALKAELQQLRLAYQMATEMAQFKAGFLARASHELRSPINSVISLHQLILSDLCENSEEEREFVAQAYAAAERMLALLDRLISISKASHGREQLILQPLQLKSVLTEVQQFTQLQAQNRNLRLNIELPDPNIYALADPRWLRQILVSLVDAPICLMQEGGVRVTTAIDLASQEVHIQIEDQRPASFWTDPIDLLHSLKPKLEEVQAVSSDQEQLEAIDPLPSPGLTLLIVQTLLDLMGGRLEILAVPAIGNPAPQDFSDLTRIQCTLPLTQPEPVSVG